MKSGDNGAKRAVTAVQMWTSDDHFKHIKDEVDPNNAWKILAALLQPSNSHNKVNLIRKFTKLRYKDGDSMTEHLGKFKELKSMIKVMKTPNSEDEEAAYTGISQREVFRTFRKINLFT
ncbi:hypothetical protein M569_13731 [Genlisea aurea]|uniref:Uncharacterized protein n=1 Tax=Genlisea aurea TaxID=192259 RepID=S8C2N9_9LAMI|nr:hypothetical protein M569_13731 [Genlisea aurea]